MTTLLSRSSEIPEWVISQDQSIAYNENDPDLHPFRIAIPSITAAYKWRNVAGYELEVKDQKWENVRPHIPEKLRNIHKVISSRKSNRASVDYSEVYEELESNPNEYKEELYFIIREQKRCLEGFTFFNNGKITYITGAHYMFLAYWKIDQEVEYRDIDRKWFVLMNYVDTTTQTVATTKKKDKPLESEIKLDKNGFPALVKTKERTVLGINLVKYRRQGATTRSLFWEYYIMMHEFDKLSGIQSKDDQSSKGIFLKQLVTPWKKLPFFLKPNYANNDSPKSELLFEQKFTTANKDKKERLELNSTMSFASTADPMYYDGTRLRVYVNDECSKLSDSMETGLIKRIQVVSQCCVLGSQMVGTVINLSTTNEWGKGGRQFFELTKDSHFEQRNEIGRTKSGFINLFMPAFEGLPGFIDEYGNSIIDKPTPEQVEFTGKKYGAREFILMQRKAYQQSKDPEDKIKLSEFKRLYPLTWADCFRQSILESPFNTELLEEIHVNLIQSEVKEPLGSRGDFLWNQELKKVDWKPHPKGRFFVSSFPPSTMTNQFKIENGFMEPLQTGRRYIAGFDPYKFTKVATRRVSEAGFSMFWDYDPDVDGSGYETNPAANNFVCTYLARPETIETSFDDVINCCIFFGAKVYYERNTDKFADYAEQNNFSGYLEYGDQKIAGYYANESLKQTYVNDLRTWLEIHGEKYKHLDIIEQMQKCAGLEDITDLDLLASAGGVMLYRRLLHKIDYVYNDKKEDSKSLDDYFGLYDY